MMRSGRPVSTRAGLGAWGERYAADWLQGLGWQVVARNWRCELGELDLVALQPLADGARLGVGVEVKCRSRLGYGDPLEAITAAKLARLRVLLARWAAASGLRLSGLRVDAVGILKQPGRAPRVRHLRGVA